jgi:hypothetical protein
MLEQDHPIGSEQITARLRDFETWWNKKGGNPSHPLYFRFREFAILGADPDIVFFLCRYLASTNYVERQLLELKKQVVNRKSRWRKEFRALCSTHAGGNLRLTEVARHYTASVINSTVAVLRTKGLLDLGAELSISDLTEIKQQALEPFANVQGYSEDWDRAINNLPPGTAQNLLAAVGLSNDTPEIRKLIQTLIGQYWPSMFQNGATKRNDLAGSMFLLCLTEHLRKATGGKPHFRLACNLMMSLQDKSLKANGKPASKTSPKSAEVRVAKLKAQNPEWQTFLTRVEQWVAQAAAPKVN